MMKDAHVAPDRCAAQAEETYVQEPDFEDFEEYCAGGYHPVVLGECLHNGRYQVVHKLGFGGYSTIWLARDDARNRYVSLKILVASETSRSNEAAILRYLEGEDEASGKRFIPRLLDEFSFEGPNGRHVCLVQDVAGSSIATSKEDSVNLMFPVETARSIAAQLIMGLSYLHARGVCHGDLHLQNILLRGPDLRDLSTDALRERYRQHTVPIRRVDGAAVEPHAPPYAVLPIRMKMPADRLFDPLIRISDFGTSFIWPSDHSPQLHCPPLYLPPEDFFQEPITLAADVWTTGLTLYEILGERPLLESFASDRDDLLADMMSTLGLPPTRWWDQWASRKEFFKMDGTWLGDPKRIYDPGWRPLRQRLWQMGRGETPETCEWDVASGELQALEDLLKGMLKFEPAERLTAEQMMESEYMVKWAMPAWERQLKRTEG